MPCISEKNTHPSNLGLRCPEKHPHRPDLHNRHGNHEEGNDDVEPENAALGALHRRKVPVFPRPKVLLGPRNVCHAISNLVQRFGHFQVLFASF